MLINILLFITWLIYLTFLNIHFNNFIPFTKHAVCWSSYRLWLWTCSLVNGLSIWEIVVTLHCKIVLTSMSAGLRTTTTGVQIRNNTNTFPTSYALQSKDALCFFKHLGLQAHTMLHFCYCTSSICCIF